MKVAGTPMRSIWLMPDRWSVGIIDQTRLPHALVTDRLTTLDEAAHAIRAMRVRGAPLTGATAPHGARLPPPARGPPGRGAPARGGAPPPPRERVGGGPHAGPGGLLAGPRPTAINLRWALD